MSVRSSILGVSAVLVVASLVYLAIDVRAKPAEGIDRSSGAGGADSTASTARARSVGATGATGEAVARSRQRAGSMSTIPGGAAAAAREAARDRLAGSNRFEPTAAGAGTASALAPGSALPAGTAMGDGERESQPGDVTGSRAAEASRLYDQHDYDGAISLAKAILADEPTNSRMIRVVVSSSCAAGEATVANEYFAKLIGKDRRDMKKRCARFGMPIGSGPDGGGDSGGGKP